MDYSSIWSLFSHTRINIGSSLQETSKLMYLPNFLTEYKSVAITGKYDNLCSRCEEKTWEEKTKTKPQSVYLSFLFGIKFTDNRSGLVRQQPFNLSLLCSLSGFAHRQHWLVHVKAGLPSLLLGIEAPHALCLLQNFQGETFSSTGFGSIEPSGLEVAALIYASWKSLTYSLWHGHLGSHMTGIFTWLSLEIVLASPLVPKLLPLSD